MSSATGFHSDRLTTKIRPDGDIKASWQEYSIPALYNPMGKRYEDAYRHNPEHEASLNWLTSHLSPGSKVLDIGCGTGKPTADALASAGHAVHGIDISGGMLDVARKHVPLATFQQTDFRDFAAEPAIYDAITSYFAFLVAMSQQQIREMIRNIYKWLKPGGLFLFGTVPADVEHVPAQWLGADTLFTSMSKDQYEESFREAGFAILFQQESVFVPKAVEAGICNSEQTGEEPQLFIYAKKA